MTAPQPNLQADYQVHDSEFQTAESGQTEAHELTQVETNPAFAPEQRASALSLVKSAVTALIPTGFGPTDRDAERDSEAPKDLPGSPALIVPVVGEAPSLVLAEPETERTDVRSRQLAQGQADSSPHASGNTVLPAGWTFRGEIVGSEDMKFNCSLIASVENTNPEAFIVLGTEAKSEGVIKGKNIVMKGAHRGEVDGSGGQVVIEASSKIVGEVSYTSIQMNGGNHDLKLQYVSE